MIFNIKNMIVTAVVVVPLLPGVGLAGEWDQVEKVDHCHALAADEDGFINCVLTYHRTNDWSEVRVMQQCDEYSDKLLRTDCYMHLTERMITITKDELRRHASRALRGNLDRAEFRNYLEQPREKFAEGDTAAADAARLYHNLATFWVNIQGYRQDFLELVEGNDTQEARADDLVKQIGEWQRQYRELCGMIMADMDGLCNDIDMYHDIRRRPLDEVYG